MSRRILWLWNEEANMMAVADCGEHLPLLSICDEEYKGINPFYSYPLSFLQYYGWVTIGEL